MPLKQWRDETIADTWRIWDDIIERRPQVVDMWKDFFTDVKKSYGENWWEELANTNKYRFAYLLIKTHPGLYKDVAPNGCAFYGCTKCLHWSVTPWKMLEAGCV